MLRNGLRSITPAMLSAKLQKKPGSYAEYSRQEARSRMLHKWFWPIAFIVTNAVSMVYLNHPHRPFVASAPTTPSASPEPSVSPPLPREVIQTVRQQVMAAPVALQN